MKQSEIDAFFLDRVRSGRIVVYSEGHIMNPKTGEIIAGDRANRRTLRIGEYRIETQRLVWLGLFGPVPEGYKIQAVNGNVDDRDGFNMRLVPK